MARSPAQPLPLSVLKAELVIVATVLRRPELAEALSRSGAVGEFVHAGLREAADTICSGGSPEAAVRALAKHLVREGALPVDPTQLVGTPKREKSLPAHLGLEDMDRYGRIARRGLVGR